MLATYPGVLVLEHLDGRPAEPTDGAALADALTGLHAVWVDGSALPCWETRADDLFWEYVDRIATRPGHPLAATSQWAQEVLPGLLEQPRTACHGDLQGKNVLLAADRCRLIDPAGLNAPAGWDAALAAASVAAHGGDPGPVLAAATAVPALADWLALAAVSVGGTTRFVDDRGASGRLLDLLEG